MTTDHLKDLFLRSDSVNSTLSALSNSQSISINKTAGSYLSFIAYGVIQQKNGYHLFVLPEKEEALYFFNDLENIFNNERGIPSSYISLCHIDYAPSFFTCFPLHLSIEYFN